MKKANKPWTTGDNVILMPVCNGTIKNIIKDRATARFSDIYVLDIGPDFHNPKETYDIIDCVNRGNKKIIWFDHHFDSWDVLERNMYSKSKNLVLLRTTSCAEIMKGVEFEKLSRNLVCFGTDVDGIISAAILCANKYLNDSQIDKLISIARKCDTASFYGDNIAKKVHQAVYIARLKGECIQMVELLVNLAKNNFMGKYLKELTDLVKMYELTVNMQNQLILHTSKYTDNNIAIFNSDNICNADLTMIFSRCYSLGYNIVIVENTKFIRVASNKVNLKEIFKLDHGMPYKIQLDKHQWNIEDVVNKLKGAI